MNEFESKRERLGFWERERRELRRGFVGGVMVVIVGVLEERALEIGAR